MFCGGFLTMLLTSAMCLLRAPVLFTSCSAGSGLACRATASDLASKVQDSGMLECSIGQHGRCLQRRQLRTVVVWGVGRGSTRCCLPGGQGIPHKQRLKQQCFWC